MPAAISAIPTSTTLPGPRLSMNCPAIGMVSIAPKSCGTTYGVSFPLLAKTDVNGPDRHPLYAELTRTPDAGGEAGDVQWNFENFQLAPGGAVVSRFRPRTVADAPEVVDAIEAVLPR